MRSLALTYVTGMTPTPGVRGRVLQPDAGQSASTSCFPALTITGECEIMVFEGIPGGPMDTWSEVTTPAEHLAKSKQILETFFPWEAERCANVELTDDNGHPGRTVPAHRAQAGGRAAQRPARARTCRRGRCSMIRSPARARTAPPRWPPPTWRRSSATATGPTTARSWSRRSRTTGTSAASTRPRGPTRCCRPPPEHVLKLLVAGNQSPEIAHRFANGFDNPADYFDWFMFPDKAEALPRAGGRRGLGGAGARGATDRDRWCRTVRPSARARAARRRLRGDAGLEPDERAAAERAGVLEPVHVRQRAGQRASAGLDFWTQRTPAVEGVAFNSAEGISWAARLDAPARSVDQRVKLSRLAERVRGPRRAADRRRRPRSRSRTLSRANTTSPWWRPAAGHWAAVRARSAALDSPGPQRVLALTYVRGLEPRPDYSAVSFNVVPGVGEYFVFPALTVGGPCEIMVFEGIPGGPMDCWHDVDIAGRAPGPVAGDPRAVLPLECERAACGRAHRRSTRSCAARSRRRFDTRWRGCPRERLSWPWPTPRCSPTRSPARAPTTPPSARRSTSSGSSGTRLGRSTPTGSNRPSTTTGPRYAQWVVTWTDAVLAPPEPHVQRLLAAAQRLPSLAALIANAFDDPRTVHPWWYDPAEAERVIAEKEDEQARGLDLRELRTALGAFATGVTVVTSRTADGLRVGVTANSFTSLSLEPPLVLWCLSRQSTSLPAFREASRFAINVLASGQHHLSRLFATTGVDKFAGVDVRGGAHEIPLLDGALAHYLCRSVRQIDAGDHVIFIGEVEGYELFDGEPLVFHSGGYRVTTRHPDLD